MELKHIIEILVRRKWIVINTFAAIFLTIALGSLLIRPWYDSKAMVFLQKSGAASTLLSSLGLQSGVTVPSSYSDTDRSDYLELAKVYPVADKVINELHLSREKTSAIFLRKIPFMKPVARALGMDVEKTIVIPKAEDLVKRSLISYIFPRPYVNVDQYESTDIIYFEAVATDPEQSSAMANAMAKAFIDTEVKRIRGDFQGAKEYIQNNISHYKNEYTKALLALREFKERERSVNLDSETAEYIKEISDLKQSQRDLYIQLAQTRTKYSPDHPIVKDYENAIEQVSQLIQKKMEKVFGSKNMQTDPALRDLTAKATGKPSFPMDKSWKGVLPNGLEKPFDDESLLSRLPQKSFEYAQLTLAVSVTQSIYNVILTYGYQVGVAESIAVANIYLVQSAKTPEIDDSKHKWPNVGLDSTIAILLGVIFGVGAGLFVEYLDDTIKTSDDLKALKAATFLGRIAKLRKKEIKLIDEVEPRSPLRESVRTIRTSIRFATIDKPAKIMLVTSSVQGEGKSFAASNLAISFANDGKKVLLLDCNMRGPSIHSYFGLDNGTGLTNYLAGDVALDSVQRQTRVSGLSVITTGPIPPDPAKLVESKKMHKLLQDMGQAFDLVIVDSPPVFAASDAQVLGHWADGTIIVVESGSTTRKLFTEMSEMLHKANTEVIGVVLNKVAGRGRAYYYT
jgi:succinoglycan biosynthesis transport protein ExoP